MSIAIVIACIFLLIVLISAFKVNPFLAFLIVSIIGALFLGVDAPQIGSVIQKGLGDMLGSLVIVVIAGAMLGKLVADTGAAQKIADGLMQIFGEKNLQVALMITGFAIGIPLFYNVGFVIVFPLIASVAYRFKLPIVYVGLPMMASLSVTHGFLPPHPSPAALAAQFNADLGTTLLYGIIISIPTVILAGLWFSKTVKNMNPVILKTFQSEGLPPEKLPSLFNSLFSALLPVMLLTITTVLTLTMDPEHPWRYVVDFFADSSIVMLLSLAIATFTLGVGRGLTMSSVMDTYVTAVKDVSMIILIIGGAGALKEVLVVSGVSAEIGSLLNGMNMHPLFLGWLIACVIRLCVGSATVAGLTAAGIVLPLLTSHPEVNPSLMVLSVGAGSLMFSHLNDSGFWLFKEYFNLSIKETIKSWSLMETIVSICGLVGVMLLNIII